MKPLSWFFLNVSSEQAASWIDCGRKQGIVGNVHFVTQETELGPREESIVIDESCSGFYDIPLFLNNCRWDGVSEGRIVELVEEPPFFSFTENFEREDASVDYRDGYRKCGITYRHNGQPEKVRYYPQASGDQLLERRPALFLDRDGIVNVDKGYVYRQQDIELCSGIGELVSMAKKKGWWVCVVSNQSGVGRGLYSRQEVESLHQFLQQYLPIDEWFFCPYHPEGKGEYAGFSHWRKPGPGMILTAEKILPIDRLNSLMVGDKESDRIHLQGLKSVLVQGRYKLDPKKGEIVSCLDDIRRML